MKWTPLWQSNNTSSRQYEKIPKVFLVIPGLVFASADNIFDLPDVDHILSAPDTQDEGVWKYEHLRQFCMELNGLAVKLQGDCKPDTCSQMTATEQWIFLCAAHKTPKECPAIDYTR